MRITIFYKDIKYLNLTKAMFRVMNKHRGGLYIDTIFFQYTGDPKENIFTYEQLQQINGIFHFKNSTKKATKYKTFRGLITRLCEEIRILKLKNISFLDWVSEFTVFKEDNYHYKHLHNGKIIGCYGDTHERYLWLQSKNYLTDFSKY